jgi:hypothetical protein
VETSYFAGSEMETNPTNMEILTTNRRQKRIGSGNDTKSPAPEYWGQNKDKPQLMVS